MSAKLRILPFFYLLATVACSGGAGTVGDGSVAAGGPVGSGGTSSNAAPLQGGFTDPGGDPGENPYTLSTEVLFAECSVGDLVQYYLKGNVQGPLGRAAMDGRILRVILTTTGKFFDEPLVGKALDFQGVPFYYGVFEFSLRTTLPFQLQFYLLPEGAPSLGESLQSCSGSLCLPADAIEVKHSLHEWKQETTVLPECPTNEHAPSSV
ncbi:MAG TPA: hypothetical protein VFW62_09590 [bacterium]|nr:hypothetical protein [bacterium]